MSDVESYPLVLIVEPVAGTLSDMIKVLRRAGYHTAGTSTFERAREQIQIDPPRVLLTGARLGAYNGLHLALLAQQRRADCQAIILTPVPDPVLEREVHGLGAVCVVSPLSAEALCPLLETLLGNLTNASEPVCAAEPPTERRRGDRRWIVTPDFQPERRVADRRRH